MPAFGACPRPESVPRAGSGQPWPRASMVLVGRDERWEGLGRMPRMLYPRGWPREWGFPLRPAHFWWLLVPLWSEEAGPGPSVHQVLQEVCFIHSLPELTLHPQAAAIIGPIL